MRPDPFFLRASMLIALACAPTAHGKAPACKRVKTNQASFTRSDLAPGTYRVTFVAEACYGRGRGRSVTRELVLRATSPEDATLYGWLSGNLDPVGAPMSHGGAEPEATSQDPLRPGVLVDWMPWGDSTEPVPILTIGTVTNLRAEPGWTDGSGIGLFVQRLDAAGFAGSWDGWGIVRACRGRFCAERIEPSASR